MQVDPSSLASDDAAATMRSCSSSRRMAHQRLAVALQHAGHLRRLNIGRTPPRLADQPRHSAAFFSGSTPEHIWMAATLSHSYFLSCQQRVELAGPIERVRSSQPPTCDRR